MDEKYDVIVLGTGLKECILSGLLSVDGKKVLHIDRNDYYGGASASLNLNELFRHFRDGEPPAEYGQSRDYSIDLIPKFILADGILVKMLLKTDVVKYLEFNKIGGSFVYKKGKVHKVPATVQEAMATDLMGMLEKRRFKNMLDFISKYDENDASTHNDPSTGGWFSDAKTMDLKTLPMSEFFKKFGVDENTVEYTGHAIALYLNDDYLAQPAHDTLEKIRLYFKSLAKYQQSPFIYPLYGLGELPQAFARLAAIWGGTYMLHTPVDEVVMEDGRFVGIRSGDQVARADFVIGDPSYFPDRVKATGRVVRVICLLDHPVAGTQGRDSVQIIIPQKQVNRKNDIYVTVLSDTHNVVPKGKFVAIVSTAVETDNPAAECTPALRLLEPIVERFENVTETFEPIECDAERVFISNSFDATSHFETTCLDVLDMYRRISGKELDLTDLSKPQPPAEAAPSATSSEDGAPPQ
eukprot:TRINITY_DN18334_c0_g1_i1.p1 TRINITY_DN18334_c0_g1~~TRINITY_DN18334_c0_g1_i1.p1  ORF type:complete len:488 (-),score=215.91 TRINITY_DN18334_c0_g1_i1:595-1995(-)